MNNNIMHIGPRRFIIISQVTDAESNISVSRRRCRDKSSGARIERNKDVGASGRRRGEKFHYKYRLILLYTF